MLKFIQIFLIAGFFHYAIAQQSLDSDNECGILNENYFYNRNETAANDEFPWLGRVYYKEEGETENAFRCQAVLISKRHLLTPASCFVTRGGLNKFDGDTVILGHDNNCFGNHTCPSPVPNYYEIDEIALNPNITLDRRSSKNNIAIIYLKHDVIFNTEVRPICLPSDTESSAHFVGQYLKYAGYAIKTIERTRTLDPLKGVGLVASLAKCNEDDFNFDDDSMCIIPNIRENTYLMAGAPLMGVRTKNLPQNSHPHPHRFYLVGLAAQGKGDLDILTRIGNFIDWIKYNIKEIHAA